MKSSLVDIIAGARPNFMKIAPILRAIQVRQQTGSRLHYRLVHTGQHYDARMSGDFFIQLGIPEPDVNLEVGSGTQAEQTAAIMTRYEKLLLEKPSDLCLVVGDVTSTMACSIAAQKLGVKVAHVEAGIRSGDWSMPEEINRMVTDAITNYFFTTSEVANQNLRSCGVPEERIYFVGNTMIDTLLANMDRLRPPSFWDDLGLAMGEYFVLTLHRPANVDNAGQLTDMLQAVGSGCRGLPVVFPVHPRTAKNLQGITCLPANVDNAGQLTDMLQAVGSGCRGLPVVFPVHPRTAKNLQGITCLPANIKLVEPQPYLEFNYLVRHAKGVITDSGGITEETTVMGIPCMTLRDSTERPETVSIGTNELLGTDPASLKPALDMLFDGRWKLGAIPPLWDGRTGERIAARLESLLATP